MSNVPLDDLYGDIYGDEDLEIIESQSPVSPTPDIPSSTVSTSPPVRPATHNLPPKPVTSQATSSSPTGSNSLSYSAQIAQQFTTAYKQTPSQERQQRQSGGSVSVDQLQTSPIPTHATQTYVSGDTVFGKKPSEMHDSGKMFVGGLNWDTTDEGLRNYFSQFGKVDACTIMRDPSGTSRGFAFMTFEDAAAVTLVLGREHILDGKSIDPKRAIPREEHLRNTRYFVGGLSPATTSESMKAFFSAYGKVVDATVMVDRETGRGKGFGFVTFEDAANADQLVGKLGLQIDEKEIEVKMAQPRSQRDRERLATSNGSGSGRSDSGPPQSNAIPTFSSQQQQQQMPMTMPMMFPRPMLGMGNMGSNMLGMGGGMNMGMGMGMNPWMNSMMMASPFEAALYPRMFQMGGAGMNMAGGAGMLGMGRGMAGNNAAGMGLGLPGAAALRGGMGINFGRSGGMMNGGTGPARSNTRGQHSFHPYSR
ncbi:hnRNP A1-gamma isoform [Mycena amicta]|nr:hnRNP A1-gamma isoform [Mycena amicta]